MRFWKVVSSFVPKKADKTPEETQEFRFSQQTEQQENPQDEHQDQNSQPNETPTEENLERQPSPQDQPGDQKDTKKQENDQPPNQDGEEEDHFGNENQDMQNEQDSKADEDSSDDGMEEDSGDGQSSNGDSDDTSSGDESDAGDEEDLDNGEQSQQADGQETSQQSNPSGKTGKEEASDDKTLDDSSQGSGGQGSNDSQSSDASANDFESNSDGNQSPSTDTPAKQLKQEGSVENMPNSEVSQQLSEQIGQLSLPEQKPRSSEAQQNPDPLEEADGDTLESQDKTPSESELQKNRDASAQPEQTDDLDENPMAEGEEKSNQAKREEGQDLATQDQNLDNNPNGEAQQAQNEASPQPNPQNETPQGDQSADEDQKKGNKGKQDLPTEQEQTDAPLSISNTVLRDIPHFSERSKGGGMHLEDKEVNIPVRIIKMLISKFLDQRFTRRESDLNERAYSFERADGLHKWDIPAIAVHVNTKQLTKVLQDRYGYAYEKGKNEQVPLSFYFDLSGSMSKHSSELATIVIELAKRDVKTLIGFNQTVMWQIDKVAKTMDIGKLSNILVEAVCQDTNISKNQLVTAKQIDQTLDTFLKNARAEKCVVFSDFDPRSQVLSLSQFCKTYWFCFEQNFEKADLSSFKGFIWKTQNMNDLRKGLVKVNKSRFEALTHIGKGGNGK